MHRQLFAGYDSGEWGSGDAADLQLFLGYARELNLDGDTLRACVESNKHAPRIAADVEEAIQQGINSTPSFVVNGQKLIGARSFATWKRLLDDLLAQQGND